MQILNFLKSNIKSDMSLLSIVNEFSQMCRIEINADDEMFLFETGPITHNDKNMLLFSMVRQFSDGNDELMQIRVEIIYDTNEIKKLSACSWHKNSGEFIQTVLLSKAFEVCKNLRIEKIEICADRT